MTRIRIIFSLICLAALLFSAGCVNPPQKTAAPASTAAPATADLSGGSALQATQAVSPAGTLVENTVAVPSKPVTVTLREIKNPDYIKMDAENYKVGEIVEFKLINRGTSTLRCSTTDPGYSVSLLPDDGTPSVVARGGGTVQVITEIPPSTPTRTYTLNTVNLTPGKYLIEFDCEKDIAREFVLDDNRT